MEEVETKGKILKGSEELFMRYGVRSISMDDIARHLSVSKKTLYQHFADKEDLVVAVSTAHLEQEQKLYAALRDSSSNAIEHLAKIAVCMKREMEELNPALLFDIQKFHPKAWSIWINFKKTVIKEIIDNLTSGIREGFVREDVNPEILSIMRIELVQLAFNEEIFSRTKFKIAEVQTQIFDHFVYGLVTDKGRKLYQKYKNKSTEQFTP
ncbi:TetR/AcrR family transcriptional regulator [Chryseotalea sanaruensis]|uniref:TetR/AcrR family transcriptional regulator n=1 Tax=Chryseotalea sanaruensis TaxID=2482724 RepID=A0A401UEQ6_9BACT|nr:TetR/AcrR family transcriptional regulator [Chryseotalea sanaruensis]GCC53388.1 TetR/AcrR family transcriptional regulator [Chryseotalea sanaruensis]